MKNIWFTSDTHFYHRNILKFCPNTREGADSEEMTELMIQRWNEKVKPHDRIYHLGDFSFANHQRTLQLLLRLNGQIHLIQGNHDHVIDNNDIRSQFVDIKAYKEIKVGTEKICMFHFPMYEWNRMHHGAWQLHGHTHGEVQIEGKSLDVGIDGPVTKGMSPVHFDEVAEWMSKREIRTHHGKHGENIL
jgi:calcineurin-like phosphoesterase family protein